MNCEKNCILSTEEEKSRKLFNSKCENCSLKNEKRDENFLEFDEIIFPETITEILIEKYLKSKNVEIFIPKRNSN